MKTLSLLALLSMTFSACAGSQPSAKRMTTTTPKVAKSETMSTGSSPTYRKKDGAMVISEPELSRYSTVEESLRKYASIRASRR